MIDPRTGTFGEPGHKVVSVDPKTGRQTAGFYDARGFYVATPEWDDTFEAADMRRATAARAFLEVLLAPLVPLVRWMNARLTR